MGEEHLVSSSGGFRGCKCTLLWRLVMYFVYITAQVHQSSGIQQQQPGTVAHISVPYWSPDVWLSPELLRDIQFGLQAILNNSLASYQSVVTIITCVMNAFTWPKWAWQPNNFRVHFVHQWLNPLSKFLNLPLSIVHACTSSSVTLYNSLRYISWTCR